MRPVTDSRQPKPDNRFPITMSRENIEQIMRQSYAPQLPYGFAERVARLVMSPEGKSTVWDALLNFSPRISLALGAAATVLLVLGFTGSGPHIIDAIDQFSTLSSILPF